MGILRIKQSNCRLCGGERKIPRPAYRDPTVAEDGELIGNYTEWEVCPGCDPSLTPLKRGQIAQAFLADAARRNK